MLREIEKTMQSTMFLDRAREWGRSLEDRESARTGHAIPVARVAVARRTGIHPGTLETLRVGRLKQIAVHVYERLRSAVVADLEAEMMRLSHELEMARQAGLGPADDEFQAAAAALETARKLLSKGG